MNSKTIKIIVFIISGILILSIILTTAGCSKLDIEIFGLKFGEKAESTYPETEDFESTDEESTGGTQDDTENSQIYLPKTILIQIIRTLTPAISSPMILIFQN